MRIAVACEEVDDGDFNHGVAARTLTHCRACAAYEHLARKSRIIDFHVKLEKLIVGLSGDALSYEIDTMTHIIELSHRGNRDNVGFIRGEIWVCLNGSSHRVKFVAIFELYIYHAAMNAGAHGDGH